MLSYSAFTASNLNIELNHNVETINNEPIGSNESIEQNFYSERLPTEVLCHIFTFLNAESFQPFILTCKTWSYIREIDFLGSNSLTKFFYSIVFTEKDWEAFLNFKVKVLSSNIERKKIIFKLKKLCPFSENGQQIWQTHTCVLLPAELNFKKLYHLLSENPHTPINLPWPEIIKTYGDHSAVSKTQYVFIKNCIVKGSRNKVFAEQEALLNKYPGYKVCDLLTNTVIATVKLIKRKSHLNNCQRLTYANCKEKWHVEANGQEGLQERHIVVGIKNNALDVMVYNLQGEDIGIRAMQPFI
jgi:hypothetical protein